VCGSRPGPRLGNRVRLVGILDGGQSLSRSSPRKARRNKVATNWAAFFPGVVTRILAKDTFWSAIADAYRLVLLLTLEVVVPSVVTSPAAVTP
jgi:hypothetical protein